MSDLFLTPEELVELTGYKQPSKQIAALRRQGVRVFVRRDGKPRVLRSALEGKACLIAICGLRIENKRYSQEIFRIKSRLGTHLSGRQRCLPENKS